MNTNRVDNRCSDIHKMAIILISNYIYKTSELNKLVSLLNKAFIFQFAFYVCLCDLFWPIFLPQSSTDG